MGRQVKSSLNHQIDLVSVDVGAMAWNSAKANDAFLNCGLHHASRLVSQGQCQAHARSGVAARRWLQRRKLAANLITQRPVGWAFSPVSGERFWRSLRFGGAGFALAWLLEQL